MSGSYWKSVIEDDFEVPTDRPLGDLTAELTRMLGSTDPQLRDGTAYPALATWTDRGVYSVWGQIQSPPQVPVLADGLFQHYPKPGEPA